MLSVDTEEAKTRLPALLALVEERGETVLICREGLPVAELRAPVGAVRSVDPFVQHAELCGRILYDPTEPATEDEWPTAQR